MFCFANGAQVQWLTCCVHEACCRLALQQPKRVLLRSKPANVPTSRRSGCGSARGRLATRWSAPSASSSSAPAVVPCGTAARSITRFTGGRTKRSAKSSTKRGGRRWLQAERPLAMLDEVDARRAFLVHRISQTSHSAAQTWSFHRRCVCVMHIRLTSHGVPRVLGAAARPDWCFRAAALCCVRSPRARAAPRSRPRGGLCHPAAVCCSSLPSAAFSVARVEAARARQAQAGGGGARPRTEVWRGATATCAAGLLI